MTFQNACKTIINKCMVVKPNEKVLIVYDDKMTDIAKSVYDESIKVSKNTVLLKIAEGKTHGSEPTPDVAETMKQYDVILLITTKSLSHTKARKDACDAGARLASMPGITKETIARAIDVDPNEMKKKSIKIGNKLKNAEIVKVTSPSGTDITINIKGRYMGESDVGIFDKPGLWGNLPGAEVGLGPLEGTTNGVFVVDLTFGTGGLVKKPVKVVVKDGYAISITGGDDADKLKKMLEVVKDKNAYNIAELGIGINHGAKVTGNTLEDEKVYGTAHIALGNNTAYNGIIDVPIHMDGVFSKPTIEVDGEIIMKDGELL